MTCKLTLIAKIATTANRLHEGSFQSGIGQPMYDYKGNPVLDKSGQPLKWGRYTLSFDDALTAAIGTADLSPAERQLASFLAMSGEGYEACDELLAEQSQTV